MLNCHFLALVHWSDNHMFSTLHNVRWAAYPEGASVEDMSVNHCGAHIPVAQQFPNGANGLTPLQQLGGATWPKTSVAELPGMPEVVGAGRFVDTGHQHRSLYSFLKQAQTQMVPALLARRQRSNQLLISCRMN